MPSYTPHGRELVVSGERSYLALVSLADGRVRRLAGQRGVVFAARASRRHVVSVSLEGLVVTHDARTGGKLARAQTEGGANDVGISPDGRLVAVALSSGRIEIRRLPGLRRVRTLVNGDFVGWSRFSPDGRLVVSGDSEGTTRLWSTRTWRPAGRPLRGHAGFVLTAVISPDGRTLASGGSDGTVLIWDLATRKQLGRALPGVPNRWVGATFSPNGKTLYTLYETGRAFRWDISTAALRRRACQVAGRDLMRAEWEQVLPDRPYRQHVPAALSAIKVRSRAARSATPRRGEGPRWPGARGDGRRLPARRTCRRGWRDAASRRPG